MPNYGKEYIALKKKMLAERRRHMSKKTGFGSCKCDEMAAEAVYRQDLALKEGKFGKATAFGRLLPWSSDATKGGKYTGHSGPDSDISMFDPKPVNPEDFVTRKPGKRFLSKRERHRRKGMVRQPEDRNLPGRSFAYYDNEPQESIFGFGYEPRLWEIQGPIYNAGYTAFGAKKKRKTVKKRKTTKKRKTVKRKRRVVKRKSRKTVKRRPRKTVKRKTRKTVKRRPRKTVKKRKTVKRKPRK